MSGMPPPLVAARGPAAFESLWQVCSVLTHTPKARSLGSVASRLLQHLEVWVVSLRGRSSWPLRRHANTETAA